MAPKAAPKAEAKAKAEAKPKREAKPKDPEDDKPKVPAPDRAKFEEKVAAKNADVDKLQKKLKDLSGKIGERSTGKDEFFTKKNELRAKLDECSGHLNKFQEAKDELQKGLGEKREEAKNMRQEVNKLKKSLGFTSEEEINQEIRRLEYKMSTETMVLKEEKKIMLEITELKRNKPKVSQYNQMESNLSSLDPGMSVKEKVAQINEQAQVYREQKKAVSEEYKALMEERQKQMGDMPELFEEREALNKQISEKIRERTALRDEFRQTEREYNAYLAEQRAVRQERAMEDRKKRDAERDVERRERAAEKLEEQPHVAEICLIEQTIYFCKNLMPKDDKEESKVAAKVEIKHTNKAEEVVVINKADRDEEFYFAPTKKGKAAKKAGEKKAGKVNIKHNVETFKLFDSMKLDAPTTTEDIPPLLIKLEEQLAEYNEKVEAWRVNREELKRKIMEGIPVEEEKKDDEDEKKEEEKKDDA